jgi:hypothetical protein
MKCILGKQQATYVLIPLLAIAFSLSLSVSLFSQVTGATLSGTISDPSGGVIAEAQISIRNTDTGISKDIQADSAGYFTAPSLAPGSYEVKITAAGFNTTVSTVTLTVGAQQQLNIQMKVGETSQTVEVTAAAPQIELASSMLTGQVESKTVVDLPLNGRDWTTLATLHPGVNLIENQASYDTSGRGNRGYGAQLTISGQRTSTNNYRLDGVSLNDYSNSGPGNVIGAALGVGAIREFSILTGGFSAEYGKASGGVVNAITKSGTNSFHGELYEFIRNSAMDARDYFSRSSNTPIAQFRRNQFGVAAGGPIIKDKTFIFGDYEGFRQTKGITTQITVPSDTARAGTLHYDPIGAPPTGCTPTAPSSGVCTVTVNAAAAAMLVMFPHATPGTSSGDSGRFIYQAMQIVPENFYTFHVDHKLSSNDNLFGTYLFDNTVFTQPDSFANNILNSRTRRQTVVLEESHTFSANFINAARFGYSRTHADVLTPAGAVNPAATLTSLGSMAGQTAPVVNIGGYDRMQGGVGSSSYFVHNFNNYQFADDAFWTRGAHTVKFGMDIERMQFNYLASNNFGGRWNFDTISDYLQNKSKHFEATLPTDQGRHQLRQTLIAGYVQDDWRVRSNLTLNLGLRYEMTTMVNDAQGKISNLVNITDAVPQCGILFDSGFNPGHTPVPPAGSVCGSVGPYFHNPTLHNFEPRVGFAWDPFHNGKTSVRGGFGVYDVLPLAAYFNVSQSKTAPFTIFASVDKPSSGANPLQNQFFVGGQNLLVNGSGAIGQLSVNTVEANPKRNYVLEWNLNVQRQVTSDLTVTLGYVGNHGIHMLTRGDDGNMTLPTLTSAGYLFPCGPSTASP